MPKVVIGRSHSALSRRMNSEGLVTVHGGTTLRAASSVGNLKKLMKEYPNTEWVITEYQIKSGVPGLVEFAEEKSEILSKYFYHVTPTGRVMSDFKKISDD